MIPTLLEKRLADLSAVRYSFFSGKHPGGSYEHEVLVIRFDGEFGFGSGGNSDASFMVAMGNAGVEAFEPDAIVIDLSNLSYEWGDMMEAVFSIGDSRRRQPMALIVGDCCRAAIGTLCFGVDSTTDACTEEWIFDSLGEAWTYVTGLLDDGELPALHQAARDGDISLVRALLQSGADPGRLDVEGRTPLHHASNSDIVQLLIEAGADATIEDRSTITPLHLAKDRGSARLLLAAGADPDARTMYGTSPLNFAPDASVAELLLEAGADVQLRHRSSLLHNVRDPSIAELFVGAGADVNLIDKSGRTPLDCAEEQCEIFKRQGMGFGFRRNGAIASNYRQIADILRANGGKSGGDFKKQSR